MSTGLDLGKQVGPLPLGGWVVVVGGGLAIAYFVNRGQARQDAGQLEPLTEPETGTGLIPAGSVIQPYQPPEDTEPEDNSAWGRKVLNWLIGTMKADPATADNAVRKYLSGENLTAQENALLNLALVKFGAPPEALPPVTVPPIPTPAPTGPPSLTVTNPATVKRGSRITFRGSARIGGKAPSSPAFVLVTGYIPPANTRISGTRYVTANSAGDFSYSTIPGIRGKRRTRFSWKGVILDRYFTVV